MNVKVCPFCGSNDIGVKDETIEYNLKTGNVIRLWAYCRNCGATGKTRTIHDPLNDDIEIKIGYKAWNERFTL